MADTITKSFDLKISGQLPGETALLAVLNFATAFRATMDPAVRDRWDKILVEQAEDLQKVWRKMWVDWGVL